MGVGVGVTVGVGVGVTVGVVVGVTVGVGVGVTVGVGVGVTVGVGAGVGVGVGVCAVQRSSTRPLQLSSTPLHTSVAPGCTDALESLQSVLLAT
jgi:hypothetical protein